MTTINSLQVIAMHGWAGDSRCWGPWIEATAKLGWTWQCGERGYVELEPREVAWGSDLPKSAARVLIGHSLGPHLIAPEVLAQANVVILLASFGTFIPPDSAGRRLRAALDGMAAKLASESAAKEMLRKFLANAAAPQSADWLPPGPTDGLMRLKALREDLDVLRGCEGLPRGFPGNARILIVEAGEDRIVDPMARSLLRDALPEAELVRLEGTGHALLGTDIIAKVADFVESRR